MTNPFEIINLRLSTIENLLLQLHSTRQIKQSSINDEDLILGIAEAADYIKLSIPSIYRLAGESKLPYIKKGKKLLFSKKALTDWLMEGRQKTLKEIQNDAGRTEPVAT